MHIKLTNGIPEKYSIGLLRRDNPQTSFPETPSADTLASWDVYPLIQSTPPIVNRAKEKAVEVTPELVNGEWVQKWSVVQLDDVQAAQAQERLVQEIVNSTQKKMDAFARTRNYDGMQSLCTYAASTNAKFRVEGEYGVAARDATWETLYTILAEVESGQRPVPASFEDIESELPHLEWPVE